MKTVIPQNLLFGSLARRKKIYAESSLLLPVEKINRIPDKKRKRKNAFVLFSGMTPFFIVSALCFFVLVPLAQAAESPEPYYVPPGQFNAVMQVMDLGLANIFGFFQSATGSFAFDEQSKNISKLRLAIDATSLTAGNPQNQNDLAALLAVYQDSEIRFTAMDNTEFKDGKASIKGTLTVHGTSKPVTLDATINHIGKSPHGGGMFSSEGDALGLSMRGSFKRADFGMTDNPDLPSRFGDTIALQLEMQAIKQ